MLSQQHLTSLGWCGSADFRTDPILLPLRTDSQWIKPRTVPLRGGDKQNRSILLKWIFQSPPRAPHSAQEPARRGAGASIFRTSKKPRACLWLDGGNDDGLVKPMITASQSLDVLFLFFWLCTGRSVDRLEYFNLIGKLFYFEIILLWLIQFGGCLWVLVLPGKWWSAAVVGVVSVFDSVNFEVEMVMMSVRENIKYSASLGFQIYWLKHF